MNKESIINYDYLKNKRVILKFTSGREIEGIMKGYDQIGSVVLDEANEILEENILMNTEIESDLKNDKDIHKNRLKRFLGFIYARGPSIAVLIPKDQAEIIENPFV